MPENDDEPFDEILPPKPAEPLVLSSRTLPLVSYSLPSNAFAVTVVVVVIRLNVTSSVVASDWSETTA